MVEAPLTKFPEPLRFEDILFKQIMKVLDSAEKRDPEAFVVNVEMLENLLNPWIDKQYKDKVDGTSDKVWINKKEYDFVKCREAENRFEQLMNLIHRSGFLPLKEIEVIIE